MAIPTKLRLGGAAPWASLDALASLVQNEVKPFFQQWEADEQIPQTVWTRLHQIGLWQLAVPKAYGGIEAPAEELIRVVRELAYGSSALSTAVVASFTAGLSIFMGADPLLASRYARSVLSHGELSAFALTEREGGSDLSNIQTIAKPVRGGYLISGEKCFVTNVSDTTHLVVAARLAHDRRPSKSLTLFYIPTDSPGVTIQPQHAKLGQRAIKTHPVVLNEVYVPDQHRIGEHGEALSISYRALQRSRCMLAAGANGLARCAVDLAQDYLFQRLSLKKPLLHQPMIRGTLAQAHTQMEAAWELTVRSARDWDEDRDDLHRVNMAKLFAGQMVNSVAGEMMQLFGGWGYTGVYPIEQLVRDAKFYEFVEGPAFVQQILIAKSLFPAVTPKASPTAATSASSATAISPFPADQIDPAEEPARQANAG